MDYQYVFCVAFSANVYKCMATFLLWSASWLLEGQIYYYFDMRMHSNIIAVVILLNLNTLIHNVDSFSTTLKVNSNNISLDYDFSVLQIYEFSYVYDIQTSTGKFLYSEVEWPLMSIF